MTDQTDHMRKVEALLRLAAKAGTPEEAASAAAKAAELCLRYGIDMQALGTSESRAIRDELSGLDIGGDSKWAGIIAFAVGKLNAARGQFVGKRIRFTGRMDNATNAKVQFEYLIETVNRLNREAVKGRGFEKRELSLFRRNFRMGAASALAIILKKRYDDLRRAGLPDQTGTALVVANYFDQEDAALDAQLGKYKIKSQAIAVTDNGAFKAGALAAHGIRLNSQVAGETSRKRLNSAD